MKLNFKNLLMIAVVIMMLLRGDGTQAGNTVLYVMAIFLLGVCDIFSTVVWKHNCATYEEYLAERRKGRRQRIQGFIELGLAGAGAVYLFNGAFLQNEMVNIVSIVACIVLLILTLFHEGTFQREDE